MAEINKEAQAAMPQKLLHELFEYNTETGGWKWIKKPHPKANVKVGQPAGCLTPRGYVTIQINGHHYFAHRLAWTYVHGDYPNGEQVYVDHVNGIPSDNRITNLRVSSTAENGRNRRINTDNTSGVTGVSRNKRVRSSGKIDTYWSASWYDENGKRHSKNFPIHTHGEDEPKQLAIAHRAEQIRLLEINHGITYSDRHGT